MLASLPRPNASKNGLGAVRGPLFVDFGPHFELLEAVSGPNLSHIWGLIASKHIEKIAKSYKNCRSYKKPAQLLWCPVSSKLPAGCGGLA